MSDQLQVVLVDDEDLIRSGLKLLLSSAADITVVGEASNGKEAVGVVENTQPDVVLMDIRMPVMDGIEATRLLARRVPIIMLTAFDTDTFIVDALQAGAVGFLLKSTRPEALVASVRAAAAGQPLLSPEVLNKLLAGNNRATAQAPQRATKQLALLSEREREIASLVAQGLDNQQIAQQLFISLPTVKSHMNNILKKIGGTSRVHIAIMVLEAGR